MVKESPYRELADATAELMEDIAVCEDDLYVEKSRGGAHANLIRKADSLFGSDDYVIGSHRKTDDRDIPIVADEAVFDQPFYCISSREEEYDQDARELAEELDTRFPEVEIFFFQDSRST